MGRGLDWVAHGCPLDVMTLDVVTLGLVVYVYLLAPYVLLNHLRVLYDLRADSQLLLHHSPLLDDHLFFGDRHHYRVFPDLRACGFPLHNRDALHRYLRALLGHDDPLPVGAHALTHPHRPGLALASTDLELLLRAAYPELFTFPLGLASADTLGGRRDGRGSPRRARGAALLRKLCLAAVVGAVAAPALGAWEVLEPVVPAHPFLELGRQLLAPTQARCRLHHALSPRDHHASRGVLDRNHLRRDEEGTASRGIGPDPDVLGVVVLVHEEVVGFTEPLAVSVVDLVARIALFGYLQALVLWRVGQDVCLLGVVGPLAWRRFVGADAGLAPRSLRLLAGAVPHCRDSGACRTHG